MKLSHVSEEKKNLPIENTQENSTLIQTYFSKHISDAEIPSIPKAAEKCGWLYNVKNDRINFQNKFSFTVIDTDGADGCNLYWGIIHVLTWIVLSFSIIVTAASGRQRACCARLLCSLNKECDVSVRLKLVLLTNTIRCQFPLTCLSRSRHADSNRNTRFHFLYFPLLQLTDVIIKLSRFREHKRANTCCCCVAVRSKGTINKVPTFTGIESSLNFMIKILLLHMAVSFVSTASWVDWWVTARQMEETDRRVRDNLLNFRRVCVCVFLTRKKQTEQNWFHWFVVWHQRSC